MAELCERGFVIEPLRYMSVVCFVVHIMLLMSGLCE